MGREVRKVPKDWKHPKRAEDPSRLQPLFDGASYEGRAQTWLRGLFEWEAGTYWSLVTIAEDTGKPYASKEEFRYYWDYDGPPPLAEDFMLVGVPESERTHFQLYETTSEGTPKGPVFETLEELCAWAAVHATTFADARATKDEWLRMLSPGGTVVHREGNLVFM